jgi:hypothetical protein
MLVYSLGHSLIKNNTLYGGIKVELSHSLSHSVASASAWITTGHRRTHPLRISLLDQLDPKTICQAQIKHHALGSLACFYFPQNNISFCSGSMNFSKHKQCDSV